jgi:class 3 adenylate cyclase
MIEPEGAMVTVMFADLRGFTSFADQSTARKAIDHLNRFFALAIPCVHPARRLGPLAAR